VKKKRLRNWLALSGGLGVVGGVALTGSAIFLLERTDLKPLVTGWATWLLLALVLAFSLGEIPLMLYGIRQMVTSTSGGRLAVLTNAAFTLFAAVYAVPFLLLTGRIGLGTALAGLCLVRFVCALWFVPGDLPIESRFHLTNPTSPREEDQ
jgi:hypothetical protein